MSGKTILQTACGLLITLAILTVAVSTVQAQAPANDDFADALDITSTPYEESFDTTEATFEDGEPVPDCWSSGPYPAYLQFHTVWYAFTPATNGLVQGYIDANYNGMAVYKAMGGGGLEPIGCWSWFWDYSFAVQAGETYYLQIGSMWGQAGWMHLNLDFLPAPANDDITNALVVSLGDSIPINNGSANIEPGEPSPDCSSPNKTVWFTFTPTSDMAVTVHADQWWTFVAAYTATGPNELNKIGCRSEGYPLPLQLVAGTTYYFQAGSGSDWWAGEFTFSIYETPPPVADFWWSPGDANIFDTIEFCDSSFDPVYQVLTEHQWDFGDGSTTTGNCVYHRYPTDGDYTVSHNVQTSDGRTDPDGITHTVSVRTHDVAITRVTAPTAARVGQTRQITIYIKNNRYPERVQVELFKSIPGGYELVGVAAHNIPVRGGNRTTAVSFSYTFVQGDADMGKVTFKAVATIIDARDALPADNEAISSPTKVQ